MGSSDKSSVTFDLELDLKVKGQGHHKMSDSLISSKLIKIERWGLQKSHK